MYDATDLGNPHPLLQGFVLLSSRETWARVKARVDAHCALHTVP